VTALTEPRPATHDVHRTLNPAATDRLLPIRPAYGWADHLSRLGPLHPATTQRLGQSLDAAGLLGRGGAGFPTGRKVLAVAAAVAGT
jgi:hypothetical protein